MQPSSHLSKRKSACFWSATTLSGVRVGVMVGVRVGVWRPKVVRESKDSLTNNY